MAAARIMLQGSAYLARPSFTMPRRRAMDSFDIAYRFPMLGAAGGRDTALEFGCFVGSGYHRTDWKGMTWNWVLLLGSTSLACHDIDIASPRNSISGYSFGDCGIRYPKFPIAGF